MELLHMPMQRPEEKQKRLKDQQQQQQQRGVVWADNQADYLLNVTLEYKVNTTKKMPSDASRP